MVIRSLRRVGAIALASAAVVAIWAPSASAAPAATIALDPAQVELSLRPHENVGRIDLVSPSSTAPGTVTVMDHVWGGTSELVLPPEMSGSGLVVSLELSPASGAPPTRTYASNSSVPADQLTLTDLGGGRYEVDMPAYDAANGEWGRLVFAGLTTTAGAGFTYVDPLAYQLHFVGSGGIRQHHTPELIAVVPNLCAGSAGARCAVPSGKPFSLTVSPTSRLRTLSLGGLDTSTYAVQALDANGAPTGAPVTPANAALEVEVTSADHVKITLGTSLRAGAYRLTVVDGAEVHGGLFPSYRAAIVRMDLRVGNLGLRSNTGWTEPVEESSTGTSPLVGIGAGMVLTAGVGGALVLRPRRKTAASD